MTEGERRTTSGEDLPISVSTWQRLGADWLLVSTNDPALNGLLGRTAARDGEGDRYLPDWATVERNLARCLDEKRCLDQSTVYCDEETGSNRYLALKYVFVPPGSVLLLVEEVTRAFEAEQALQRATETAETARQLERERRLEVERRRQIAESLRDILAVLNTDQPVDTVLSLIATQARQLLGTQAVGIYRLESDSARWAVEISKGLLVTYVAGFNAPVGQDTLRRALVLRRPIVGSPAAVTTEREHAAVASQSVQPTPSGWTRWYRAWLAVPIIAKGETYGGMLLYYTEPRALSEEEIQLATTFSDQVALAIENARLRERTQQAAALAERERLARELHDAITQTLFSASVIAEAMPRIWDSHPDEARRAMEELRKLTRGALVEMRTMLVELRPAVLTEKPLGELLSHLGDAMSQRNRIPVVVNIRGDVPLQSELQVALYRIAQEALANVVRHAAASKATVTLHSVPGRVELQVQDDGRGFYLCAAPAGGLGLRNMRERAAAVGAVLEVKTCPGEGTQVQVLWEQHPEERANDA
ncbi:MAG: histidine kinase [Anaerolineae bacterium]